MQLELDNGIRNYLKDRYPLISIIIPVYNKGAYLQEALQSLLQQNYPNLEILIRDDGSTDNSASIINALPSEVQGASIRVFRTENMGASYSRNYLIERASSRIIILMDADDIMLPGLIEDALATMRETDSRIIYSDVELFGVKEGEWCPQPFDAFSIRYDNCLTSLAMLDRQIWEKTGGYDVGLPFNEDWSFFIRATQVTNKFHKIPKKYFRYRQTSAGLYHSYIQDNWSHNLSLVMLANPDLYPVGELLEAARSITAIPEDWVKKYEKFAAKYPERSLPQFVLGIIALSKQKNEDALNLIQRASLCSNEKEWLPLVYLAELIEKNDPMSALKLYNLARTKRPDTAVLVNPKIKSLIEQYNAQSGNLIRK